MKECDKPQFQYMRATKIDWINKTSIHCLDGINKEDIGRASNGETVIKYLGDTVIVVYSEYDDVYVKEFSSARVWKKINNKYSASERNDSSVSGKVTAYKSTTHHNDFMAKLL